jgi:hypothetical protein
MNAAIWFGAAVFAFIGAYPALTTSPAVQQLLGPKFFPYYSVALGQLVLARFFSLYMICSVVALIHLLSEWLYFGKYPSRLWLTLLFTLCVAGLFQSFWLQPRLAEWHRTGALRPYTTWRSVSNFVNVALLCGLGLYLWRVASPPPRRG